MHVRLTELHTAHQNLPPAIRTLRLNETIQNIHQKRTKSDNMIRTYALSRNAAHQNPPYRPQRRYWGQVLVCCMQPS